MARYWPRPMTSSNSLVARSSEAKISQHNSRRYYLRPGLACPKDKPSFFLRKRKKPGSVVEFAVIMVNRRPEAAAEMKGPLVGASARQVMPSAVSCGIPDPFRLEAIHMEHPDRDATSSHPRGTFLSYSTSTASSSKSRPMEDMRSSGTPPLCGRYSFMLSPLPWTKGVHDGYQSEVKVGK